MDVVYVLGTGSKWNDNEIRFSLRSIEKNLLNAQKVFIVGECPEFIQNVIHIKANDIFSPEINADGNIITKVLSACADERLSDDFLFINDDHIVIKEIAIEDVKPFHKGDMTCYKPEFWKLNFWRKRLHRTMEVLRMKGLSTLHFDCHTPILFNKHRFPEVVKQFNYQDDIGYTMKSIYGNSVYHDAPLLTDEKKTVFQFFKLKEIDTRLEPATFLSFNDLGLNTALKWWLINSFPEKSQYEKNSPDEMIFRLYDWVATGKNYRKGVDLFKTFNRNRNFIQMLELSETPELKTKLDFKLNQIIKEL